MSPHQGPHLAKKEKRLRDYWLDRRVGGPGEHFMSPSGPPAAPLRLSTTLPNRSSLLAHAEHRRCVVRTVRERSLRFCFVVAAKDCALEAPRGGAPPSWRRLAGEGRPFPRTPIPAALSSSLWGCIRLGPDCLVRSNIPYHYYSTRLFEVALLDLAPFVNHLGG
jgi:hypothetical protein